LNPDNRHTDSDQRSRVYSLPSGSALFVLRISAVWMRTAFLTGTLKLRPVCVIFDSQPECHEIFRGSRAGRFTSLSFLTENFHRLSLPDQSNGGA
jgi:hypothetical protein